MMSLTRFQTKSLPITPTLTLLLQPSCSHWAQIILYFANPCAFPPLAGVSCVRLGALVQHHTLLSCPIPPTYITKTIHRFPPDPFIFPLHHRHLSTRFPSLKTTLREAQSFLLIILY